jgi:opacity protein-like surface antigen
MLRKVVIATIVFTGCMHLACAKNLAYKAAVSEQPPVPYYKGEAHYKGELPPSPQPPLEPLPCMTYTFNPGFYLGINPGLRTNYSPPAIATYKAFEGTVFGGYTFTATSFYFAAEIDASHSAALQNYSNRLSLNANGNPVGLKTTWGVGLSLLPGYVLSDTLLAYLRLGSATTHFQDVARTKTGGQVGIGLQGTVSERWDLRAEYVYSFYPSLPVLGNPRSDEWRFGLVYKL